MIRYVHTCGSSNREMTDLMGAEFHSRHPLRHSGTSGHRSRSERDWSHTHNYEQGPTPGPPQGTPICPDSICLKHSLKSQWIIPLPFTSQDILCDVPRLQYIIVVDSKRASWTDVPRGILIYNMDTVKEMGSKPDNSEWTLIKKLFILSWKSKCSTRRLNKELK